MLFLANTPNSRQHEFVSAAKKVLETWQDVEETYRGQASAVNGATRRLALRVCRNQRRVIMRA